MIEGGYGDDEIDRAYDTAFTGENEDFSDYTGVKEVITSADQEHVKTVDSMIVSNPDMRYPSYYEAASGVFAVVDRGDGLLEYCIPEDALSDIRCRATYGYTHDRLVGLNIGHISVFDTKGNRRPLCDYIDVECHEHYPNLHMNYREVERVKALRSVNHTLMLMESTNRWERVVGAIAACTHMIPKTDTALIGLCMDKDPVVTQAIARNSLCRGVLSLLSETGYDDDTRVIAENNLSRKTDNLYESTVGDILECELNPET